MVLKTISALGMVCLAGTFAFAADTAGSSWKKTPGTYAVLDTSQGRIVCVLFEKETPKTLANFTGLTEGTKEYTDIKTGQKSKKRFYDGLIFHRVIPEFMIQGGDPLGKGFGGPGYTFEDETVPGLTFDRPGRLAMANSGPNTNGSQFFITEGPTPWLNGRHTIFGQVVEGQEVVNKIARVPRDQRDKPVKDVVIRKITIERIAAPGEQKGSPMKSGKLSGKKVLFVVAPEYFRDEEYFQPKEMLAGEGAEVVTASLKLGELTGMLGGKATSDILVGDVNPGEYSAVIFVGGEGAFKYYTDPAAHRIARDTVSQKKLLAAICVAPGILARAGVLEGKQATIFPMTKNELLKAKATYTAKPVEQDGDIITANGPEAAKEFGQALVNALSK